MVEYHSQIVTIGWNDVEHVVIILESARARFSPNLILFYFSIDYLLIVSIFVLLRRPARPHFSRYCSNGGVLIYDLDGTLLRKFNLEGECKKPGILSAKVWGTGLVCLTKNFVFYALLDFDSPFTIKLKNPGVLCSRNLLSYVYQSFMYF